jgi:hypothetical protein
MSAAGELQKAIFAALTGDPTLAALVEGRVLDRLAERTAMPVLGFAGWKVSDWSTDGDAGEEHTIEIAVWSDLNGRREAQAIMAAVKAVLHDARLALAGFQLVNLRLEETRLARVEKTRRHEGMMRFRAVTEAAGL